MKKINYVILGLLILLVSLSVIFFFQTKAAFSDAADNLDTVLGLVQQDLVLIQQNQQNLVIIQQNQQNLEESIDNVDLQLTTKITELSKDTEKQRSVFGIALNKVKNLIVSYTEEAKNKNAAERLLAVNALVESDNSTKQLLSKGFFEYENENFPRAIKLYKEVLDMDSGNIKALCYHNASLYYRSPGDVSIFTGIKKSLIHLLEKKVLSKNEELTTLNVLMGISMEESDSVLQIKYQNALTQLKVE